MAILATIVLCVALQLCYMLRRALVPSHFGWGTPPGTRDLPRSYNTPLYYQLRKSVITPL
eukprot:7344334-Pyramimonas_sp.AAC.1